MGNKHAFYEDHGVEEYYVYEPDSNGLMAFVRRGDVLQRVRPVEGHVSPRLGIRFDVSGEELVVYRPDGQRFLTFPELEAARPARRNCRNSTASRSRRLPPRLDPHRARSPRRSAEATRGRASSPHRGSSLRGLGRVPGESVRYRSGGVFGQGNESSRRTALGRGG
jgi:hypothetical protein